MNKPLIHAYVSTHQPEAALSPEIDWILPEIFAAVLRGMIGLVL